MVLLSSLLALKLLTLSGSPASPPKPGTVSGIKLPTHPHAAADTEEAAAARAKSSSAIRSVDLRGLVASPLGMVPSNGVLYGDLTGDGREEVVLPVVSSGSAGFVAVAVYGYDSHGLLRQLLFRQGTRLEIALREGGLEISEPSREPGDEPCCPSGARKATRYMWNGQALEAVPGAK